MQAIPQTIRTLLKSRSMVGPSAPRALVTFLTGSQAGQVSKSWPSTAVAGLGWRFSDRRLFAADAALDKLNVYDENGVLYDSWAIDDFPNGAEIDGDNDDLIWVTHPSGMLNPGIKAWQISTKTRVINFPNPTGTTEINGVAAPTGPYLWVGDSNVAGGKLHKVNKSDGIVVATYDMPIRVSGVAWDGQYLWVSGISNTIYKVDPITGQTIESFIGPADYYSGLTWDGQNLWGGDDTNDLIVRFSSTSLSVAVSNIRINRQTAATAQRAEFSWPNVNPSNHRDPGYYSPDRAAPDFTPNEWQGMIMPGRDFTIQIGYGEDITQAFKGQVDDVELGVEAQDGGAEYIISCDCRDDSWKLMDKTVDNGTQTYALLYQNITVEDMVRDLLIKAGWLTENIITEATGITVIQKEFKRVFYADALEWAMQVSGFELVLDEYGKISFHYPTDRQPESIDTKTLIGVIPVALDNSPVVAASLIVKHLSGAPIYALGVDYTYDAVANTITRIATGAIADGQSVNAEYVYAAWVFKEGEDLFRLPYRITRRNVFGKVQVIGKDANEAEVIATYTFANRATFGIPDDRVLFTQIDELDTLAKCQLAADQIGNDMSKKPREVSFAAVANPWIQVGDCVQVIESSTTISEIYRINSIEYDLDQEGFIMVCTGHHYGYAPLV